MSISQDQEPQRKAARTCAVVSLERSAGPAGATDDDWYRYVINIPGSPIIGYRRGSKRDVLAYLDECVSQLDERLNSGKAPRARSGPKPNQPRASS